MPPPPSHARAEGLQQPLQLPEELRGARKALIGNCRGLGLPGRGQPQQLIRLDDDDPITSDVQSVFPPEKLQLLRHGLSLDDQRLKPAKVEWQNPEQLRFVLTEGKKRQIRRMCELVGLKVVGLKRVRVGKVMLGNLPVGQWRYLQPHEKF